MNRLLVDWSGDPGWLALAEGSRVVRQWEFTPPARQSGPFYESLQAALNEPLTPAEGVIGLGPGRHGSLRITMAACRAACEVLGIPLKGLASGQGFGSPSQSFGVVGKARRNSCFHQRFLHGQPPGTPEVIDLSSLESALVPRDIPWFSRDLDSTLHSVETGRCQPEHFLAWIIERPETVHPHPLEPIYLHPPLVTAPTRNKFPGLTPSTPGEVPS